MYFHIIEALLTFFALKRLAFVRFFVKPTLAHILLGSTNIFYPSFTNKPALTSLVFLIPNPPSYIGLHILSYDIK